MGNKIKSDFLVATPSLASGAGRLLDLCGQFDAYNISRDEQEADAKAMFADWRIVGEDLNDAMSRFETSQSVK